MSEGILRHAEGVDLLPGNIELSGLEISLTGVISRETMLGFILDNTQIIPVLRVRA